MSETNNFTKIKSESTESKDENKPEFNTGDKIYIYEKMFDYQCEQQLNLISTISEIRSVCNYLITGIIAFTGFVISTKPIETNFRKVVFYGLLSIIILFWILINSSLKIPNGFKIEEVLSTLKDKNVKNENKTKEIIMKTILLSSIENYKYSSLEVKKLNFYKQIFLFLVFIFFILILLILNFPVLNLTI